VISASEEFGQPLLETWPWTGGSLTFLCPSPCVQLRREAAEVLDTIRLRDVEKRIARFPQFY
jgi:hypothetical protein